MDKTRAQSARQPATRKSATRQSARGAGASLRCRPIAASLAKMGRQASLPALMAAEMLLCGNAAWADTPRIPVNALPSTPTTTTGSAINYQVNGNTATITQTAPTNIVKWNSFDIGQNAKVNIVQPSSSAVLLNNVAGGAYMNKTVIDGALNANGRVYIYNPNGILFGKSGTVNVNTLMASSLKFDESRVIGGLLQPGATPVLGADTAYGHIPGDILVESGANLNANNGGLILLAGPKVVNNGQLNAPDGQVILAAGSKVYLAAPQVSQTGTSLRGLLVEVSNDYPAGSVASAATVGSSTAENGVSGQIKVGQGNATMIGYAVNQNGIVSATTSVNLNGSIYLYARDQAQLLESPSGGGSTWQGTRSGQLVLGGNSVTEVLPTPDDKATISATTAFNQSVVKLNGNHIELQQNASVIAPGGNVTIKAERLHAPSDVFNFIESTSADAPRVDFAAGSLVDVSGSSGTKLAMESNVITVDLRGTELADNVVLRESPLYATKVNIDVRKGTPIANVSGWLDLVQYNLGQKNAAGGTVNVSANDVVLGANPVSTPDGAIIQRAGSKINVDGGWVDYMDGHVNTTQLQQGDKRVDIGSANANTLYTAAVNLADGPNNFELGYRQGSSAGTVKFSAPILALQGGLSGQAAAGIHQRDVTAASHPQGGQLQIGNVSNDLVDPATGRATKTDTSAADKMGFTGDLRIGGTATENAAPPGVGEAFDLGNADQSLLATRFDLDTGALALAGFSRITALTSGNISVVAPVNLAAGGRLWLGAGQASPDANGNLHHGGDIQFGAPVTIPGGSVTAAASGTLQVADGVSFDLAGRWTNDQILASPVLDGNGNPVTPMALKGGKLNLSASQLLVGNNVSMDVSAGAWLGGQAKTTTGNAGSITLEADPLDGTPPSNSALRLGSGLSLSGYGFSSGGALNLVGRNVNIGTPPAGVNDADLWLQPAFFQQGGFTSYDIAANVNFDVLANTVVQPRALSWVPKPLSSRISSGKMATAATPYLFDLSGPARTRPSTSVTFRALPSPLDNAGRLVVEDGAQLVLDPGANLNLYAGRQLTVLGTLNAPAGHIALGLNPEVTATPYSPSRSIWFGANAQILAAGSRQRLYTNADGVSSGEVLDGGTIQVGYMNNNGVLEPAYGYVVAENGAAFDVSGIGATGLRFKSFGAITPKQDAASSGGSIEIRARDGLLFDGILSGAAGGAGASSGSLTVALESAAIPNGYPTQLDGKSFARILTILPSRTAAGSIVPAGLQPDQAIVTDVITNLDKPGEKDLGWFLKGSSTSNNSEYPEQGWISATAFASGGFGRLNFKSQDVLAFGLGKTDLTLSARDSLILDAPNLRAFNNSANNSTIAIATNSKAAPDGNTLTLSAPYIQLGNANTDPQKFQLPGSSSAGNALLNANGTTLNVNATTIDLIGNSALQGFDIANLNAKSDIRLVGVGDVVDANGNVTGHTQGSLAMVGNLTLTDAQTYPTTMSDYTFMVAGNGKDANSGTLTFAANGNIPQQALSAGGSLTAIAQHIIQGGQVVAPFGSITLGNSDDTKLSAIWDKDEYEDWIIASSPNNPLLFGSLALDNLRFPNDPRYPATTPDIFNQPIVTADLIYKSGSVTSVAGSGTVPFGSVSNGSVPTASTWTYNNVPISFQPNDGNNGGSVLPGKAIISNAQTINTDSGSVQDLSGGGSLFAYEFTPGKGGSRDVLDTTVATVVKNLTTSAQKDLIAYMQPLLGMSTPDISTAITAFYRLPIIQQTQYIATHPSLLPAMFAINPNFHGSVAPIDGEYGSAGLKPGDSVYLSGMPGLAAGIYTLLPAHYALLPGSFSISAAPGTRDMQPGSNTVLPDGSMLVAGDIGTRSNGFIVSSNVVVKSKSEFALYDATTYFSDKAKAAGVAAPELPADGGHIAFDVTGATSAALVLNGAINLGAAADSRRGTADISAPQIEVVSDRNQSTGNAIKLVAGDLTALGADSLLLGGLRDTVNGSTHVAVGASNVTFSNDAQHALSGPEIVIVANDSINLDAGASVQGKGASSAPPQDLTLDGSGALLRVSGGDQIAINRSTYSTSTGTLNIASGATVGATGSAILDGTKGVVLNGQLAMAPKSALSLGASGISLGSDIPASLPSGNLQLGTAALAKLSGLFDLSFNSYASSIDLYGTVNLGSPAMHSLAFKGGGLQGHDGAGDAMTTIVADTVRFTGVSANAGSSAGNAPSGTLTVNANTLEISNNAFAIHGYADSTLTARGEVKAVGASGQLSADHDLTLAAGRIVTASGAAASFTAGGDMTLTQSDADGNPLTPPSTAPGMGGRLNFSAKNIHSDAQIVAPSGKVMMSATDSIDISGGQISAAGKSVAFGGTTAYAPGGTIALNGGDVTLEAGAVLDVSAAGASAGKLSISAGGSGTVQLSGILKGRAAAVINGVVPTQGQFALDTDQAGGDGEFGALNAQLNAAGFTESRQFRFRDGDVTLGGSDNVTAHQVVIAADNGSITVGGNATIDASGAKGGSIELYASQTDAGGDSGKVTLRDNARLLANATAVASSDAGSTGNGGTVVIGTGNADGVAATSVGGGSSINLLGGIIDVGGSSAANNGTVTLRAPRVYAMTVDIDGKPVVDKVATDVAVAKVGTVINNSSATVVEANGVYQGSTIYGTDAVTNNLTDVDPDTNLDPGASGKMYKDAASFMTSQATILQRLAGNPAANLSLRPGIEVRSEDELTVSVNEFAASAADRGWDLSTWRFGTDNVPVTLTLRAAGDLNIVGSISDGFVKPANSALAMPDWKLDAGASASYRLVAGADLAAAHPLAVQAGSGDVKFAFADRTPPKDITVNIDTVINPVTQDVTSVDVSLPWKSADGLLTSSNVADVSPQAMNAPLTTTDAPVALVRTGTGSIDVAAGRDVTLEMAKLFVFDTAGNSKVANYDGTPVIANYKADKNTNPGIFNNSNSTPVIKKQPNADGSYSALPVDERGSYDVKGYGASVYTAGQAATLAPGFVAPQNQLNTQYGAPTGTPGNFSAAFGSGGGAISIDAGRDVNGPKNLDNFYRMAGTAYEAAYLADPTVSPKEPAVDAVPAARSDILVNQATVPQMVNDWLFRQGRSYVDANGNVQFEQTGQPVLTARPILNAQGKPVTDMNDPAVAAAISKGLIVNTMVDSISGQSIIYGYAKNIKNDPVAAAQALGMTVTTVIDSNTGKPLIYEFSPIQTAWWARYDYFNQGVATFGGGDVRVSAAANVSDLSASVATNAYAPGATPASLKEQGGGDLSVRAGGDIRGGTFYVQKGAAMLRADGSVTAGDYVPTASVLDAIQKGLPSPSPIYPVLALGDAAINLTAGRSLAIATAYNPMLTEQSVNNANTLDSSFGPINGVSNGKFWNVADMTKESVDLRQSYAQFSNFTSYGANSSVNLMAVGGDLLLANDVASLAVAGGSDIPNKLFAQGPGFPNLYVLEPSSFSAAALSGNLSTLNAFTLMPSSRGQLDLLAAGSISLNNGAVGGGIRMLDNDPSAMSNSSAPRIFTQTDFDILSGTANGIAAHVLGGLHTGDTQPVEIVAVAGDISGDGRKSSSLSLPKFAQIQAGNDIIDLGFSIQQNSATDVTTVTAGNDFIDSTQSPNPSLVANVVTGPGRIDLSAGRNVDFGNGNGLVTRGNLDNPYLSEGGAGINIVAGAQPDYASFVSFAIRYGSVDAVASSPQAMQDLRAFVGQRKPDFPETASAEDLWAAFRSLSQFNQARFLDAHPAVADRLAESAAQLYQALADGDKPQLNASFFSSLVEVSKQSKLDNFDLLVASLFPKAAQSKGGDIDVFASQIKTEQDGAINLFTPAGSVYAGLTTGTASKKPSEQGIFTIRGGAINAEVKNDFLVNQGRVFTLGGGDITLVSQYGNIDAGKGAKTASSAPPPQITIDPNGSIVVDVSNSIAGSGIATLKTHADQPAGNIYAVAPRGIFDAGDAGVRSSGTVEINALVVQNGLNITAAGFISGGMTTVAAPALGSVAAPASAASSSGDATKSLANANAESANSALNVEVLGYGDNSEPNAEPSGKSTDGACKKDEACDDDTRKKTI